MMHITLDKLLDIGWSEEEIRTLSLFDVEKTSGRNIWVRRVYETWAEVLRDISAFSNYRILKSKLPVCESCGGTGTLDTLWEKERSGLYFYDCPDCQGTGIGMPEKQEPEIKPCPFCGGGKVKVYKYKIIDCFYFKCLDCEITSDDYDGENAYQAAIEAANRRA